jgi:hypothetical protein
MPAEPSQIDQFDPAVLSQLACPACLGSLSQEESRLVCASCGRAYPIVDGIPVLIAERVEQPPVS